jgi:hypothetical protein
MPSFHKPLQNKGKTIVEMAEEEFIRGFFYRMGERAYEAVIQNRETITVRNIIFQKTIAKIQKESSVIGTS